MIVDAFGIIAPASTSIAVLATANQIDPAKSYFCQAVGFQVLGTNSGSIFICTTATPNLTTGAGILWEIPPPASANSRPAWVIGDPSAYNPINAAQFYILPAVSGEGVRVSTYRTGTKQINWS